jgi:hypothetical protein
MKTLLIIPFIAALSFKAAGQTNSTEETRSEDVNVYTDPVRRIVKVVYYTSLNSEMHFSIVNGQGETVLTATDKASKGEHSRLIDLGKYPREKYKIVVENERMKQEEQLLFN